MFAKIGRQQNDSNWDLSLLSGRSNLLGNGLLPSHYYGTDGDDPAEPGMYETNRRWVYTHPDRTRNELNQLTFNFQRLLDGNTELALNAYVRQSKRRTVGGDAEREWDDDDSEFEDEAVLNYTNTTSTSYGTSANLTKLLGAHQLTVGAAVDASRSRYGATQAECDDLDATRAPSGCDPAADQARMRGKNTSVGLYASDTLSISDRTFLTAGGRFNHAVVGNKLDTYLYDDDGAFEGIRQTQDRFTYNSFNPSFGITHKATGAITVFGNVAQSNRVPTPIELGCADPEFACRLPTGLQADPYLKQVIARTLEGGFRLKLSDVSGVSVAIYRSENKDDILFRAKDQSGLGYFENFDRTRRQGVDVGAFTSLGALSLRVSYSYLDATYQASQILFGGERDIQVRPGTKIAGLPDHTLKLNADWRATSRLVIGGTVVATSSLTTQGNEDGLIGPENDEVTAVNAKVKGYTLLNLHANYEAAKGLDYFARINNVFDTRFESYGLMALSMFNADGSRITGVNDGPNVSRFVAPGAPRSVMVGVRYRF